MDFSASISELVLNARRPCVLRKVPIPWRCFDDVTLDQWCKQFDKENRGEKVEFEKASLFHSNSPQWERYRIKEMLTIKEFLKRSEEAGTKEHWLTFSYKDLSEMPETCRQGMDFSFCGFPNASDISFWLSSVGAHTPCHFDTYGCNIVVQVFGRKMWLLFPPDTPLTSVRVPYEESSVYCSETFYSPGDLSQYRLLKSTCFQCILEPGDVLIVPNKWWHYVESLSTSLSVNTWIPLQIDNDARIEECIVKYIVNKFTQSGCDDELIRLLNPNEIGQLENETVNLSILNYLFQEIHKKNTEENLISKNYNYQYLEEQNVLSLASSLKAEWISQLPESEFNNLIVRQGTRFVPDQCESTENVEVIMKQALINAICNPQLISKTKSLFFKYAVLES